jgi:hypothetical protein
MGDWKTRLELKIDNDVITPVDSFNPTFTTTWTPVHSLEASNVGAIVHPTTATFTLTVKAMGPSGVATLTKAALEGKKFQLQLAESSGTDWTFKKLLFRDCLITSISPSNTTPDGAPVATVNGIILGFGADSDIEVS